MKCTALLAIATVLFASCKVVEISKQPVKTTVENTPTVNVGNFPTTSGINANVTNTNPIPVSIQNAVPVVVKPVMREERSETIIGRPRVSYTVPNGYSAVIEYMNFTTGSAAGGQSASLTIRGEKILLAGDSHRYGAISEKVYIPLTSGEKVLLQGVDASGNSIPGTALLGIRLWKND